ncbi:MAG: hypothetical protein V1777_03215 [Candidatus Micrarchaeota archaeon]
MRMPLILTKKTGTSKDAIIQILADEPLLSIQDIFSRFKKQAAKPISYQAVHKLLKQLETEGVVDKMGPHYRLRPEWIFEMEKFVEQLKTTQNQNSPKMEKPRIQTFEDIIQVARFLLYDLFEYPKSDTLPIAMQWNIMYSLIGLSKEEMDSIRRLSKTKTILITCKSNSLVDKILAKTFEKNNAKVKLGIHIPDSFDTIAVGDHVCEIYFDNRFKSIFKALWNKPKKVSEFNLDAVLEDMHKKWNTKAIIYYDPARAGQIRSRVLKEFDKK